MTMHCIYFKNIEIININNAKIYFKNNLIYLNNH